MEHQIVCRLPLEMKKDQEKKKNTPKRQSWNSKFHNACRFKEINGTMKKKKNPEDIDWS